MGMFDDIRVPLSNFEGVVTKKQFSILKYADKRDFLFQTKCFDNTGETYRINRKKLYKQENEKFVFWPINDTILIYNSIKYSDGKRYWIEFNVRIVDGLIEDIRIHDFDSESEEDAQKREEEFEKLNKIKNSLRFKFFNSIGNFFLYISSIFHSMSGIKAFESHNADEF